MERIVVLLSFALASAFLLHLVKPHAPHFALVASLCAGIVVLTFFLPDFAALISRVREWMQTANLKTDWIGSLLKILAVCLLGQWGSRFCRDAGEESLAEKLETAVKLTVLILCVPYVDQLFSLAVKFS